MRIRVLCLLMTLTILAAGCGSGGGQEIAEQIRERYAAPVEAVYTVTLRTDFGDRVLDFGVEYTHRPDGGGRMKVLSPGLIAGIEAEIGAGGASLTYGGMILEMGPLPGTGFSPMESLPFILNQWKSGYITQTGKEKRAGRSLAAVTTRLTQGDTIIEVRSWFDTDTLNPVNAELYVNGFMTVNAMFE
ncbi:MAG: hypothetical protein FWG31_01705 [Oscillospiraceae bacterium]|nr:hypothetical protein [Oscillospiraceae bacterium]